jgi:hypothetical protein
VSIDLLKNELKKIFGDLFRAIPNEVLDRLNKLTSRTKELENVTFDKIYPHHAKALQIARIAPKIFPIFRQLDELNNNLATDEKIIKKREKEKKRKRDTYFCVGLSTCSLCTSN